MRETLNSYSESTEITKTIYILHAYIEISKLNSFHANENEFRVRYLCYIKTRSERTQQKVNESVIKQQRQHKIYWQKNKLTISVGASDIYRPQSSLLDWKNMIISLFADMLKRSDS